MDCDIIYYINHLRKRREKKDENKLKRVVFLIILLLLMKTINVLVISGLGSNLAPCLENNENP